MFRGRRDDCIVLVCGFPLVNLNMIKRVVYLSLLEAKHLLNRRFFYRYPLQKGFLAAIFVHSAFLEMSHVNQVKDIVTVCDQHYIVVYETDLLNGLTS